MGVFPNGVVGLCCCDAKEVTNLGDVSNQTLKEIWEGTKYGQIRKRMKDGRFTNGGICKYCDFVDTGLRIKACTEKIESNKV